MLLTSYKQNTASQFAANANADRPKLTWHSCEKPGHYINRCVLPKKQKEQTENTQNNPGNKTEAPKILSQIKVQTAITTTTATKSVKELNESQKMFVHTV